MNKEKNTKLGEGLRWLAKESYGIQKKKKGKKPSSNIDYLPAFRTIIQFPAIVVTAGMRKLDFFA